ncbi:Por secretion system C-terminal sorting domain-containing protein [Marivirga sericea]|uniref:Por secretion system C-terminal sorting domain-containing protein n=1 Tax=Marivirga sericea TaxID=1028 RepID=A0A1X7L3Y9_9BACT|nr:T9SS type A sorting domain-containing protein [Marivirga sericea]SMG48460.1 Por secretion system C-terminal sorting domain-containing protein [Marivirga sericea]
MKELYLLLLSLFISGSVFSQAPQQRKCAAQTLHDYQMDHDPLYKNRYKQIQRNTKAFQEIQKSFRSTASTTVREIPVYVHIIYDENVPEQNLSNAQIESQIEVLNEDFRALNTDVADVPTEFESLVSDYQLIFTLEGISRKSSTVVEWDTDNKMKSTATGGVDAITPETHLNIWVCKISGDILGYAQFPGGSLPTDGVVVGPNFFGSSDYDTDPSNPFYLSSPYDKGRTTTHEIGHYLNLRHIWGDGGCSVDDGVGDTPLAADSNGGCPSYPSKSCAENTEFTSDMFMNYMDYTNDACMFMFSEGQKTRSYALFEPGGFRENLGIVQDGCSLSAPTNLSLSGRSTNSLSLVWDAVAEANSYDVWVNGIVSNTLSNSIDLIDLAEGNTYTIKVTAKCSEGGIGAYSEAVSFNTLGCYSSPLTFTLNTDKYGDETSWVLSLDGVVVQTDSITYGNETTYTENFDFEDGNYTFEIKDSFGDGICCGEGNGSYTITDADGRIIKSGGEFEFSETVSFCVGVLETVDCENTMNASLGINTVVSAPAVYEFKAMENSEYIISSVGLTTVDTDLNIYSDCNTIIAENDNAESLQSEIRTILEAGQIIYIQWNDTHSTDGFDWSVSSGKNLQSITWDVLSDKKVNDLPFELKATASSNLEVSYSSSNLQVVTVNGKIATIIGAGEATITAIQEGNEDFLAAPVAQKVLVVSKVDQIINISSIPNKYTTDHDFEFEAEVSSGLDLTYEVSGPAKLNGTTISLEGTIGEVTLTAVQVGNEVFKAATTSTSFQVTKDPCLDFVVSELITSDINCFGGQDGSIEVMVSGGIEPYTYSLNGSAFGENNTWEGLLEGEYSLVIMDDSSCVLSTTATIKSPTALVVDEKVTNSSSVAGNGAIDLTVSGGTKDYAYDWNTGANTSSIENLETGIYSVIVTDGNGCSVEESFEVGGVTSTDHEKDDDFIIYPNPAENVIRILHNADSDYLNIYSVKGVIVKSTTIIGESTEIDVSNLSSGLYFIRLNQTGSMQKFIKE